MTKKEIIDGLQFTIDMFLSDPLTGEPITKPRNDMDKTTIDACKGAIELLEQQSCYNPDEWCHDCSEYDHDKHCCHRWSKVIRNTVEEMKQESCEDAISREDAMSMILCYGNEIKAEVMDDIKASMIKLPPVTPQESKTGHWIDDEFGSKCSCCGIHTHLDKFDKPMKFKHCSMCGAKMESEET